MKKKNDLSLILTSIICIIPFVISAIFYNELPSKIATHFNSNGIPDGYSSKMIACFGIPALLFIINLVTNFALSRNPMEGKGGKVIGAIGKWTVPILAVITQSFIIAYARGIRLDINFCTMIIVGLITMVIGNYLPKCEYNRVVGIKTPWALKNKDNWKKTHRIAGFTWVIAGFILCINAFIESEIVNIIAVSLIVIIPMAYSYIIDKKR